MNWSGQKDRVRRLRVAIVSSFLFFARVIDDDDGGDDDGGDDDGGPDLENFLRKRYLANKIIL